MPYNVATDMAINAVIAGVFAIMKAQGMAEEEAKQKLIEMINKIEQLKPLPVD